MPRACAKRCRPGSTFLIHPDILVPSETRSKLRSRRRFCVTEVYPRYIYSQPSYRIYETRSPLRYLDFQVRSAAPRHEQHPEYTQMSSSEFLNRNSSGKATDPLINFQVNIPEDDIWDNFVTGDRASSKPQPRPSESKTSPKKRRSKGSNVTRACGNCRKRWVCPFIKPHIIACCGVSADGPAHPHRRTRCDGQPRCSHCVRRNEECTYVGHTDGRKTAAKEYVEMLESRIKQLERERSTSSVEPTACPLTETSHLSPLNSTATTVQHEKSYQLSGEFTSVS